MKRLRYPACCWTLLLFCSARPAASNEPELANAVKNRDGENIRSLLRRRVDVNAPQGDGATALHWAAHWNDEDTAARLIDAHANVNAATDLGVTPIYLAAEVGS